jgi:hypothetical protein
MSHSADALYKMSEVELLAAYAEARREFVEKKFTRYPAGTAGLDQGENVHEQ